MPPVTRLLVIRHGQTAWNADGRIQGHQDIALDALGLRQAEALASALHDEPLHAIYSSDLLRARATAQPLQRITGLPLLTETGLRERAFGRFEGLSFVEIEQRWPDAAARWRRRDPDFEPGGGESLRVFRQRTLGCVTRLARTHAGGCIALVTHGGVLDMLYREANGLPLEAPRNWEVANGGINRLLHTGDGLVMLAWADVAHLEHMPSPAH
ncbi:MAG: histidine phosphatase family protein [Rubrivivax sp.]